MTTVSQAGPSATVLRVAMLTNNLSPHTLPLAEEISRRVGHFRAILSADSDTFHGFPKAAASFQVRVQRSFNATRFFRRNFAVRKAEPLHIPYDTYQQLRDFRPNVVLSCQFGVRTILAILYRQRNPGTHLILWAPLSCHTERHRAWYRRTLRRWMVRHIDGAFVNGTSGAEYLQATGFSGPVAIVPYTIDDSLFRRSEYGPRPGVLRLLYCGRTDASKGILRFCSLLSEWCSAHPELQVALNIVGEGPDSVALVALATPPGLRLYLHGHQSQTALARQYKRADMFVFPSMGDEWGVVVNEAMSAGLPVLGSIYSQAVVELVQEGEQGWTFDPEDEEATRAALQRALSASTIELQRMSAAARQRIAALSPERVASHAVQAMLSITAPPEPLPSAPQTLPVTP